MKPLKNTTFAVAFLAATLAAPSGVFAAAGGLQICAPSTTCEVGEFLYDDEYSPITGASCTITAKYPDASAFVTGQAMTGESDGWYGYTFTAPTTQGMYRAEVCCTSGSDYLCIDKSFEVSATAGGTVTVDASNGLKQYGGIQTEHFQALAL